MEATPAQPETQVDIKTEAPAPQHPGQLPLADLDAEINPWTKEFLKNNLTANDAILLTIPEKKEFVKNYYVADGGYEDKIEKMIEEAEAAIETELENEEEAKRYTEKFFYSMINLAKGKTLDQLIKVVEVFYKARRATVNGIPPPKKF
jgi:ATP-dependent Clp protease ATP-binding subunit ClpA